MWGSLQQAGGLDPQRFGQKAHRLAQLADLGIPTAGGWVLDVEEAASAAADPARAHALAEALLSLDPAAGAWLLRSSSPQEDRPGSSLAGMLASRSAIGTPESVAAALLEVASSGAGVRAGTHGESVAVAVLAQHRLPLAAWWTVELHPDAGVALLEGWHHEGSVPRDLQLQLDWNAQRSEELPPLVAPVLGLARAALERLTRGAWQFEIGALPSTPAGASRTLLLQARPAVPRWASATSRPAPAAPREELRDDLPRFPLFAADTAQDWVWDAEHCPTPLCPLLAGWFARWLAQRGPEHGSRLIDGRWHDRTAAAPSAMTAATTPDWTVPAAVVSALRAWSAQRQPAILARLAAAERAAHALEAPCSATERRTAWRAFMGAWLAIQEAYFGGGLALPRAWAAQMVAALAGRTPPVPLPALGPTEASRRDAELTELALLCAREWAARAPVGGPPSAAALQAHLDPQGEAAAAIAAHLHEHAHAAVAFWDGRAAPLEEDAWPLWSELAQRMAATASAAPGSAAPRGERATARFETALAAACADEAERAAARAAAETAARIVAAAEDDDALLARAYAVFRRAARRVAAQLAPSALAARAIFDLLPADLEAVLAARPPAREALWSEGVQRGRALAALWENRASTATGATGAAGAAGAAGGAVGAGRVGEQRHGLAAAPGRARGPVMRLDAAQQAGGPRQGSILVVPTLFPGDAIVLARVAAVISEAGGALSHAAVLAREWGVPAVVALPEARAWLAHAHEVLVDGDAGLVTILSA